MMRWLYITISMLLIGTPILAQQGSPEFSAGPRTVYNNTRSHSLPQNVLMYSPDSSLISVPVDTLIKYSILDSIFQAGGGGSGDGNGIYSGDGSITNNRTIDLGSNEVRFENNDNYFKLRTGGLNIGQEPDPMFGGGRDLNITPESIIADADVPMLSLYVDNPGISNHAYMQLSKGFFEWSTNADASEIIRLGAVSYGLRYTNFSNWDNLQPNSLVPKDYVDTAISDLNAVVSQGVFKNDAEAASAGVQKGEYYYLAENNTLGGSAGTLRRRIY